MSDLKKLSCTCCTCHANLRESIALTAAVARGETHCGPVGGYLEEPAGKECAGYGCLELNGLQRRWRKAQRIESAGGLEVDPWISALELRVSVLLRQLEAAEELADQDIAQELQQDLWFTRLALHLWRSHLIREREELEKNRTLARLEIAFVLGDSLADASLARAFASHTPEVMLAGL